MILALDQGTTSSREPARRPRRAHRGGGPARDVPQHSRSRGWVEHDPRTSGRRSSRPRARRCAGRRRRRELAAIGITNQRETTVVWERAQRARRVAPAIVWQDRRTAERCASAAPRRRERWCARAPGCVLDPYFSATKLALAARPRARRPRARRARRAGLSAPSTAGSSGSSPAAACTSPTPRTPRARCSWTCAAAPGTTSCSTLFGVPARAAARGASTRARVVGETDAALLGARRCPSPASCGDQQAALFGQACFAPGTAKSDLRHRLLPAAAHRRRARRLAARAALDGRAADATASAATRSRAACSSPARRCSGCATGSAIIASAGRGRGARARRCRTRAGCTSCPPSPGSARRTGTRMRAAPSSASPAAPPRAPRARRPRGHRVPGRRPRARDGARRRRALARAAGRRRRLRERPAAAVPGRPAGGARGARRRDRDRRPSGRPCWPGLRAASGATRPRSRSCGGPAGASSLTPRPIATPCSPAGGGRWRRSSGSPPGSAHRAGHRPRAGRIALLGLR